MKLFDLKIGARVALAFGLVVLTIAMLVGAVQTGLFRSAANSAADAGASQRLVSTPIPGT